jgi:hypothetical protein
VAGIGTASTGDETTRTATIMTEDELGLRDAIGACLLETAIRDAGDTTTTITAAGEMIGLAEEIESVVVTVTVTEIVTETEVANTATMTGTAPGIRLPILPGIGIGTETGMTAILTGGDMIDSLLLDRSRCLDCDTRDDRIYATYCVDRAQLNSNQDIRIMIQQQYKLALLYILSTLRP